MGRKPEIKKPKDIEVLDRPHSEISPSNADRWWNCPGSVLLCRGVPKGESSFYAKEGTVAHTVLEKALLNNQNPYEFVGLEYDGIEVTEEMADAASLAVDVIRGDLRDGGELVVDKRYDITPEIAGTIDAAVVRPFDRLIVYDFKYGKGVIVSAKENLQMMLYALGIEKLYDHEVLELVIIQPRSQDGEPVSRWVVEPEVWSTFRKELDRHIELTKDPTAPQFSGSWCKFCPAKAVCPALRKDLSTALAPVGAGEVTFPDVKVLSTPQLTKIMDVKDRLEAWLEAVSAHCISLLESGVDLPGYMLAARKGHRKWRDEQEVIDHLQQYGDDIYDVKLKSPAQIEKTLKKLGADKDVIVEVSQLTEVPSIGNTIKKVGIK